jgi:hypothetical protein
MSACLLPLAHALRKEPEVHARPLPLVRMSGLTFGVPSKARFSFFATRMITFAPVLDYFSLMVTPS